VAPQLASAPNLLAGALHDMEQRGLSRRIPWIISEYGYSAFAARAEIGIEGALLNADIVESFSSSAAIKRFCLVTRRLLRTRFSLHRRQQHAVSMDDDGSIKHRFATYFGARLLTQEWCSRRRSSRDLFGRVKRTQCRWRRTDHGLCRSSSRRPLVFAAN